jgi:hypothetical protein
VGAAAAAAQEAIDRAVPPILAAGRVALAAFDAVFADRVLLGCARHREQGKGGSTDEHSTEAR